VAIVSIALVISLSVCSCRKDPTAELKAADVLVRQVMHAVVDYSSAFPESFPAQVAVYQAAGKVDLGLVHALLEMGIPFFVASDLDRALLHRLLILGSDVRDQNEALRLANHVKAGGSVLAFNATALSAKSLFGFKECSRSRRRHRMVFKSGADAIERYLNRPEEIEISLGSPKVEEVIWTNSCISDGNADVLASFDDGSPAILRKRVGAGAAYLVGMDWKDVVLRNQANHDFEAERHYVNAFEPGSDVWMLLLRAWYESWQPDAVRLATIPNGQSSVLLLSHDVDWAGSFHPALEFAALEERHKVASTFFVQTKYVSDNNSAAYFFGAALADLKQLYARGFSIGSHTVIHSAGFNHFPLGGGDETFTNYAPRGTGFATSTGGTVLGEVRVSKQLLDGNLSGQQTVFFRAGHLRVPPSLPEALQRCGYLFDSSFTADDVLTNFPYALPLGLEFEEDSGIYEFPVTLEDEEKPQLKDRIDGALDVIKANAENGAITVILIHTNEARDKLEAEEALLRQLPAGIVAADMNTFARFWRARDRLQWRLLPGEGKRARLSASSGEAVGGLTFEFRRRIATVNSGARLLEDRHRVVLPDLKPGQPVTVDLKYGD
jgi:hypothetical protein